MPTNIDNVQDYTGNIALRSNAATFPQDAEDQYTYLAVLSQDLNVTVNQMNTAISETNDNAISAEESKDAAVISAAEAEAVKINNDAAFEEIQERADEIIDNITYSAGFVPVGVWAVGAQVNSLQDGLWYEGELRTVNNAVSFPVTVDGATPELDTLKWANQTLEARKTVARSLNVKDSQVIYATDTVTPIPKVIYDAQAQKSWLVPEVAQGKLIDSVVSDQLTTTEPKTYTLNELVSDTILTPELFGAIGDGVTDDSECIQSMMDAAEGRTIQFPSAKTYKLLSPVSTHNSNITILGNNATLDISEIDFNSLEGDEVAFSFKGQPSTDIALLQDAVVESNEVYIPLGSDIQEGDLIQVWMNDESRFPDPSVGVDSGQLNVVTARYDSTSTKLVLDSIIFDTLEVLKGASLRKVNPVENITVMNLKFKGRGRNAVGFTDDKALGAFHGKNIHFHYCKFEDVDLHGIRLETVFFGSIAHCDAKTVALDTIDKISYAYIYSSSQHITIHDNTSVNYRHGIVSSHLSNTAFTEDYHGINRFVNIHDNNIRGNYGDWGTSGWVRAHAGISTHTDAEFISVHHNNVTGCRYGINPRGYSIQVDNNELVGNKHGIYLSSEYDKLLLTNNVISRCLTAIRTTTAARALPVTKLVITGNEVSDAVNGINLVIDNGVTNTGLAIKNNTFENIVDEVSAYPALISVQTPFKGTISGNDGQNCDIHGIITLGEQELYIHTNNFTDMNSKGSGLRNGMRFRTLSPKTVVTRNYMSNIGGAYFSGAGNVQVLDNIEVE